MTWYFSLHINVFFVVAFNVQHTTYFALCKNFNHQFRLAKGSLRLSTLEVFSIRS